MTRNPYFLLLILFLSSAVCGGQEKVFPLLFEETSFDFGTAKEDGGELVHVYRFANIGLDTVVITQIRSLCSCTRGHASSRTVPPGAKGTVKVTFNPYGYSGDIHKGVTVRTKDSEEYKLVFSVNLVPRKKPVEEEFPVLLKPGLRMEGTEFNFLQLAEGGRKSLSLRFVNVSERLIRLGTEVLDGSGMFSVSCPDAVPPGGEGEMIMTYMAEHTPAGFYKDSFILWTEEPGEKIAVKVKVCVTDDFSRIADSAPKPSVVIGGSTYVNAGTLPASSGIKRVTYTLKNAGDAALSVRDVDCPEGLSVSIERGTSVSPGVSRSFVVSIDPARFPPGSLFETVRILSNDPSSPIKELMIAAKITG